MFNLTINEWEDKDEEVDLGPKYEPELLPGVFTVNDSGKKVKFAKGNLYWNGSEFRCEENQYDSPTEWNPNHVGHFFWSKDARVAYAEDYDTANTAYGITPTVDDTFFATNGGAIEGYTVLSDEDWYRLYAVAAQDSNENYCITINGKRCAVLKPDGFSGTVADTYTATEWAEAESTLGLVALPFAGYRYENNIASLNNEFFCWTPLPDNEDAGQSWNAYFNVDDWSTDYSSRSRGYSIRLVQVQ